MGAECFFFLQKLQKLILLTSKFLFYTAQLILIHSMTEAKHRFVNVLRVQVACEYIDLKKKAIPLCIGAISIHLDVAKKVPQEL